VKSYEHHQQSVPLVLSIVLGLNEYKSPETWVKRLFVLGKSPVVIVVTLPTESVAAMRHTGQLRPALGFQPKASAV
jgi:hypothetical protein